MPRASQKSKAKSQKPALQRGTVQRESLAASSASTSSLMLGLTRKTLLTVLIVLVVVLLVILGFYKKNWFIAAMVNGKPISNFELQKKLNSQFRTQTLQQMINEKILLSEVEKNHVTVSDSEINDRIGQIEKSVGGPEALDNLLSQQGQTRASLKDQLHLQVAVEKLYEKDATFSAEELNKFMVDNKASLTATDPAAMQQEAENALKQQKLSAILSEKFKELKDKAQVTIF